MSLSRFQRVVLAPYAPSLKLIIFPFREVTGWHFCFVKAFCSPVKKDKLIWLVLQLNLASHWRGFGPYISNTQIITTNFATPFIFYTPPETKPRSCVLGIKASFYCYNFWKKQTERSAQPSDLGRRCVVEHDTWCIWTNHSPEFDCWKFSRWQCHGVTWSCYTGGTWLWLWLFKFSYLVSSSNITSSFSCIFSLSILVFSWLRCPTAVVV